MEKEKETYANCIKRLELQGQALAVATCNRLVSEGTVEPKPPPPSWWGGRKRNKSKSKRNKSKSKRRYK